MRNHDTQHLLHPSHVAEWFVREPDWRQRQAGSSLAHHSLSVLGTLAPLLALLNQTFFMRILVGEDGTVDHAELTPVYSALSAWKPSLGRPRHLEAVPSPKGAESANPDPIFRGQGSHKTSLVEPTDLRLNRSARLPGGRMSLDDAE